MSVFADGGAAVWCNKRVVGCSLYEVKIGTFSHHLKKISTSLAILNGRLLAVKYTAFVVPNASKARCVWSAQLIAIWWASLLWVRFPATLSAHQLSEWRWQHDTTATAEECTPPNQNMALPKLQFSWPLTPGNAAKGCNVNVSEQWNVLNVATRGPRNSWGRERFIDNLYLVRKHPSGDKRGVNGSRLKILAIES